MFQSYLRMRAPVHHSHSEDSIWAHDLLPFQMQEKVILIFNIPYIFTRSCQCDQRTPSQSVYTYLMWNAVVVFVVQTWADYFHCASFVCGQHGQLKSCGTSLHHLDTLLHVRKMWTLHDYDIMKIALLKNVSPCLLPCTGDEWDRESAFPCAETQRCQRVKILQWKRFRFNTIDAACHRFYYHATHQLKG